MIRELILDAREHADQVDLVVRLPKTGDGRPKEIARLTFADKTLPYRARRALAAAIVGELAGTFVVRVTEDAA